MTGADIIGRAHTKRWTACIGKRSHTGRSSARGWAKRQSSSHPERGWQGDPRLPICGELNDVTAAACATYFWARLAHYIIYTMGVPVLRRLTFVVGFAAEIVLVLAIFRWV